jgi:hypothetical protein
MVTAIFLSIALLLGYATTVVLSMATTFAITSASKNFVVKDFKIRRRYKFLQDLLWLPSTFVGAYVASLVAQQLNPWLIGTALVVVFVGVLWMNAWEMRQRGVPHQIAMTLMSVAGVATAFVLRYQQTKQ